MGPGPIIEGNPKSNNPMTSDNQSEQTPERPDSVSKPSGITDKGLVLTATIFAVGAMLAALTVTYPALEPRTAATQ